MLNFRLMGVFVNLLSVVVFLAGVLFFFTADAFAQVPSMVCLGNCPIQSVHVGVTMAVENVTVSQQAANTGAGNHPTNTGVSPTSTINVTTAPTSPINTTPSPTIDPCIQHMVAQGESGENDHHRRKKWKQGGKSFMNMILDLIKKLLEMIMQLLGVTGFDLSGLSGSVVVTKPVCPSSIPSQITPTTYPTQGVTQVVTQEVSPTVGGANLTVGPTSVTPQVSASPSGPVPSIMPPASATSGNWAGYVYSDSGRTAGALVTSTWVVGNMTCNTRGIVSPWVGFGGDGSNEIAQLGVDYDCRNGSPAYRVWTEAYPAASVYYSDKPVNVGDKIVASVTFAGNNSFSTKIDNVTQGWTLSLPMTLSDATGGEVIVEQVGSEEIPNFDPIVFTDSNFTNNGGAVESIALAPQLVRYEMTHAAISGISGSSFTSTYK